MKCYYTGEECDCGGELDTECPHDDMRHDDEEIDAFEAMGTVERRMSDLSCQLEEGNAR